MQAADTPAFANAPEFFNNAVGDIVTADAAAAEKQSKTKKALIIGIVAVVVTIAVIGAVFGISAISNSVKASAAQKDWTRFANYVLYGEEKDDELPEKSTDIKPEVVNHLSAVFSKTGTFYRDNEARFYEKYNKAKEGILAKNKDESFDALDKEIKNFFEISKLELGQVDFVELATRNDLSALHASLGGLLENEYVELNAPRYYVEAYRYAVSVAMMYRQAGCVQGKTLAAECVSTVDADNEELNGYRVYQTAYGQALEEESKEIMKELVRINNKAKQ
jgi:hypothetical protein